MSKSTGKKIKGNKDVYERQFAQYLKSNSAPENMVSCHASQTKNHGSNKNE